MSVVSQQGHFFPQDEETQELLDQASLPSLNHVDVPSDVPISWGMVLVLVVFHFLLLVGLPFYNKAVFSSYSTDRGVGAITPTIVMLLGASIILFAADFVRLQCCSHKQQQDNSWQLFLQGY